MNSDKCSPSQKKDPLSASPHPSVRAVFEASVFMEHPTLVPGLSTNVVYPRFFDLWWLRFGDQPAKLNVDVRASEVGARTLLRGGSFCF
jgi:hypothetical protein